MMWGVRWVWGLAMLGLAAADGAAAPLPLPEPIPELARAGVPQSMIDTGKVVCPPGSKRIRRKRPRVNRVLAGGFELFCARGAVRHGPYVSRHASASYGGVLVKQPLDEVGVYVDGLREGRFEFHDVHGRMASQGGYLHGKKQGEWYEDFFIDGAVLETRSYQADVPHGPWRRLARDGTVEAEGQFDHGLRDGAWRTRQDVDHYRAGKLHGTVTRVGWNGVKAFEGHYQDGRPAGTFQEWDPDGKLLGSFVMKQGSGVFTRWHAKDKPAVKIEWRGGTPEGSVRVWSEDGVLVVEAGFAAGRLSGSWTQWWQSGQLESKGAFAAGVETGPWEYWYSSAIKAATGSYRAGKRHGVWTTWDSDGVENTRGEYEMGVRVGTWKVDDRTLEYRAGKLIKLNGKRPPPPSDHEVEFMDGRLELEQAEDLDIEPPSYDWCAPDGLACGDLPP